MNQRIEVIDTIRGFSLFGIFLVNMLYFSSNYDSNYIIPFLDKGMESFINFFGTSNFIILFSLLFGVSIVMLQQKIMRNNRSFLSIYFRRMSILIVFGLLHTIFLWSGDILLTYGTMGIILTLFINRKPKTLLVWGSIFFLIFIPIHYPKEKNDNVSIENTDYERVERKVYEEGSYLDHVQFRIFDEYSKRKPISELVEIFTDALDWGISLLPIFLFGMYIGKKRWLFKLAKHIRTIQKIWIISGSVSFSVKILALMTDHPILVMLNDSTVPLGIAIFYASSIILLSHYKKLTKLFQLMANIGKMSITNYLMQSFIATTIFYSYSFDLASKIGFFGAIILAIFIYVLQLTLSTYWLKTFHIGPVEYVWRFFTYWEQPSFKRT
ncbi:MULTISPECIES: DUF418 domain-containing protein [Bacillus cereus group]|uniref:DUF418 domain-containing protein n=1 Tax=Bacillus cereus group TaxID=86661 RepID=UPI0001A0B0AB|nr:MULTISPECIES: DUF418 domain-containing protein [Bacillus cereus group]EEL48657.1 hypothetical protein bcere0022_41210 [Bacillus cereus Rock3-44]PFA13675.1 DUF418 domain-containing protein [Bacillus cereus]PFO84007.1 DUF418 domain-containing protein [Bacillus cereus]PFR23837.1 DUF418 domain-containing protein [Bacillus cereus]PGZ15891.1 DUF418 domain-containing protein [Bacillus cereus]